MGVLEQHVEVNQVHVLLTLTVPEKVSVFVPKGINGFPGEACVAEDASLAAHMCEWVLEVLLGQLHHRRSGDVLVC